MFFSTYCHKLMRNLAKMPPMSGSSSHPVTSFVQSLLLLMMTQWGFHPSRPYRIIIDDATLEPSLQCIRPHRLRPLPQILCSSLFKLIQNPSKLIRNPSKLIRNTSKLIRNSSKLTRNPSLSLSLLAQLSATIALCSKRNSFLPS